MARYIDADKIEWHEQLEPFGNGKYEYCRVVYMDDIDDILSADVPHWIPCSERLPVDYRSVLVSEDDETVIIAYYDREFDEWHDLHSYLIGVDAWMELPQPYQAERREA